MILEIIAGTGLLGVALSWYCAPCDDAAPCGPRHVGTGATRGAPDVGDMSEQEVVRAAARCGNAICSAPLPGPGEGQVFLVPAPGLAQPRRVVLCPRCAERVVSRAHLRTQLEGIRLDGAR